MLNRKDNKKKPLYHVKKNKIANDFPDITDALKNPNGLLAIGGDLNKIILLNAYKKGIFPWYSEGEPIMWWSPNPRCILKPYKIHISHSLKKSLRKKLFEITFNKNFIDVINECSAKRNHESRSNLAVNDTWITSDVKKAFISLHKSGYAHSVECWYNGELVGGLYGIAMGKIFFGESMFSRMSNTSKITLIYLAKRLKEMNFKLIDCQVKSNHLITLGAQLIKRKKFSKILAVYCDYSKSVFE
tara:strand:- start:2401 stop:3132 length:732 start_codon:yes stop_codon:yes gene_type:complete